MDFEELVMRQAENKYQNMMDGTIATPFSSTVEIKSYNSYVEKRRAFYHRLDEERLEFNSAIAQTKKTRDELTKYAYDIMRAKNRDKRRLGWCWLWTVIGIVVVAILSFIAMRNGATVWAKEILIPEAGFKHFFALLNSSTGENAGFEIGVLAAILVGIMWLIIFILCIKEGEFGSCCGVFFGGMFIGAAPISLPYLLFRLILVGLSWVIYFILTPLGSLVLALGAIVAVCYVGVKFELKRFKFIVLINVALLIVTSLVCSYFGNNYVKENQTYYVDHNGASMETALEVESGNAYTVFIRDTEDGERGTYYLKFTPTNEGKYNFFSTGGECTIGMLYSSSGNILVRANDNDWDYDGEFNISYRLAQNQTYYLKVGFDSGAYWSEGHFKVHIEKN